MLSYCLLRLPATPQLYAFLHASCMPSQLHLGFSQGIDMPPLHSFSSIQLHHRVIMD
jgi:hypothetical protein